MCILWLWIPAALFSWHRFRILRDFYGALWNPSTLLEIAKEAASHWHCDIFGSWPSISMWWVACLACWYRGSMMDQTASMAIHWYETNVKAKIYWTIWEDEPVLNWIYDMKRMKSNKGLIQGALSSLLFQSETRISKGDGGVRLERHCFFWGLFLGRTRFWRLFF